MAGLPDQHRTRLVARTAALRALASSPVTTVTAWLDRVDPGTNRRIKGLRLVTAFGLAWLIGARAGATLALHGRSSLAVMAAGFALWASVSEAQTTRAASSRDLVLLVLAGVIGATMAATAAPFLVRPGWPGPELVLVSGAFFVGYLRRFGVLGAGLGSQLYIGQLLGYGLGSTPADFPAIALAGLIAAVAAVVPRVLSGPAEHPALATAPVPVLPAHLSAPVRMGLQAAAAALAIVLLNDAVGLEQSVWAITACTYVIAATRADTLHRVFHRIIGTAVGVPLALAFLPVAVDFPLLAWIAAALAMVIYAMALPERYDIACGAFAFALIVTLASTGDSSLPMLLSRAWETLLGGAIGLTTALLLFPIRTPPRP